MKNAIALPLVLLLLLVTGGLLTWLVTSVAVRDVAPACEESVQEYIRARGTIIDEVTKRSKEECPCR